MTAGIPLCCGDPTKPKPRCVAGGGEGRWKGTVALATAFASEGQGPLPSTRTVHLQPFVTCHKTSQGNERLKSADSQGQTRTPGEGGGAETLAPAVGQRPENQAQGGRVPVAKPERRPDSVTASPTESQDAAGPGGTVNPRGRLGECAGGFPKPSGHPEVVFANEDNFPVPSS